jgi:O-succinylbenzoic acid--CoA ligase
MLTYGNHWHSAVASTLNLGHRPDDRWLCCLPLFHVGGLAILMRGLVCGTAAAVHASFDPPAVNRAIDHEGITGVSLVSEMLRRVLADRAGRPAPPRFRQVLLGGGPAPLPLLEACARGGLPVVQSYGLTETASQVAALAPEDAIEHPASAGRALPGSQLRIVRHGRTVRPGAVGEILVRGPTVMAGYFGRPEASRAALAGGWLHTGDLGRLDGQGRLHVLSRRDDLIVRGGENVYPAEIESVLAEHPLVLESGVTAVADERWGQAPVANVRLRDGAAAAEAELMAFCRQRLAAYKVPVRILQTGPLPRNAAGKLLRGRLRTTAETDAQPLEAASAGTPAGTA